VTRNHQNHRAFTLIEVMLAVVIFAIVLSAIHMLFHGALQLRNKTTEAIEKALPVQQTIAIIQRDLANITMPGGTMLGELQTSQLGSGTNTVDVLNPVNDTLPGQSTPAFYTASGMIDDNGPWADVERVSYALLPSTNGLPGKDLVRRVTRNLLPVLSEQPDMQYLMNGVDTITVLFYDGLQWREYWDSTTETNKLPYGIKIQLQLTHDNSDRTYHAPIEIVAPVILRAGTNEVAQTTGGTE
jgi:type II secretion system protein J